jgi:hypothetical protein
MRTLILSLCLLSACTSGESPNQAPASATDTSIVKESNSGPVSATVTLSPKEPVVGDSLTLELRISSMDGIAVTMPPYGEALGRFQVLRFRQGSSTEGGKTVRTQTYTLQSPLSGRQRVPPLRVEFVDERSDAGAHNVLELLTDEISIQIASVLDPKELESELRPALGSLDENPGSRTWLAANQPTRATGGST